LQIPPKNEKLILLDRKVALFRKKKNANSGRFECNNAVNKRKNMEQVFYPMGKELQNED